MDLLAGSNMKIPMDDRNYPALREKTTINEDVGIICQKAPPNIGLPLHQRVSSKEYPRRLFARTGRRSARMSTTRVEHAAAELTMSTAFDEIQAILSFADAAKMRDGGHYSALRGGENTTRGKASFASQANEATDEASSSSLVTVPAAIAHYPIFGLANLAALPPIETTKHLELSVMIWWMQRGDVPAQRGLRR
ncbi:hypothetical protein CPC08DRAFT_769477 [Agrocybe pediades]|nr:hypothetical protein CPC08DRAFT_769477 [Agrocybe pediades]